MSNLNKRLTDLETQTKPGELPHLAIIQSLDDPNVYTGLVNGDTYRRSEFPELRQQYTLIVVEYKKEWRTDE